MLAESATLYAITAGLMLIALLGLLWANAQNQLVGGEEQAYVIFDDGDLDTERPWEDEVQRAARQARWGPLRPPRPGQWGGAR